MIVFIVIIIFLHRFNAYLKLFLIMGGHIVVWPIFLVWPTPTMLHMLSVFEVVQSGLISVILVCKGNIKRSLHTRFSLNSVMPISKSVGDMDPKIARDRNPGIL